MVAGPFGLVLGMFPSPYGDFVFQLDEETKKEIIQSIEFPSPYGDFVFQPFDAVLAVMHGNYKFPSPYGDFVFQR